MMAADIKAVDDFCANLVDAAYQAGRIWGMQPQRFTEQMLSTSQLHELSRATGRGIMPGMTASDASVLTWELKYKGITFWAGVM